MVLLMSWLKRVLAHWLIPGRSNNHRSYLLHPELLVALIISVTIFGAFLYSDGVRQRAFENILGYASDITPDDVIRLTNVERSKLGLSGLTLSPTLSVAAQAKGQDMFSQQYWSHTSPTGKEPWDFMNESGYSYRVAGENLARDFGTTPNMVEAWMASPTHKANIVNPRYTEIGIAVINGSLQGVDTTLVVQMFGTPRATNAKPSTLAEGATSTTAQLGQTSQPGQASQPGQPSLVNTANPGLLEIDDSFFGNEESGQTEKTATDTTPTAFTAPTTPTDSTTLTDSTTPIDSTMPTARLTLDQENNPLVLARFLVPIGEINPHILFSPRELAKAFALGISILLLATLIYDLYRSTRKNTVRSVGKNLGHILLLLTVIFLLIFLKGGLVG